MNDEFRIDRDILIAGITSAVSVIGICLVLFLGLRPKPDVVAAPEPTATPFKYRLLATETHTPDPALLADETPLVLLDGPAAIPTSDMAGSTDPSLPVITPETPDLTAIGDTPTVDEGQILAVGKYDDTDVRITYYGDWTTEFFVEGAFEESLSVSALAGSNTVTFSFTGRQLVIGYLGSSDFELGVVTVAIDASPHQRDQSTGGSSWTSPQLIFDEHFVVLTHQTGDVIYLDYIEIR